MIFFCSVCSNVAKYSDKSHSQIQFLNEEGENNTYTLSRNVKIVCVFTGDLHSSVTFKQNKPMFSLLLIVIFLSKIAFRVLPRPKFLLHYFFCC